MYNNLGRQEVTVLLTLLRNFTVLHRYPASPQGFFTERNVECEPGTDVLAVWSSTNDQWATTSSRTNTSLLSHHISIKLPDLYILSHHGSLEPSHLYWATKSLLSHQISIEPPDLNWAPTSLLSHHISIEPPHIYWATRSFLNHHISIEPSHLKGSQNIFSEPPDLFWATTSLLSQHI